MASVGQQCHIKNGDLKAVILRNVFRKVTVQETIR